MIYGAALVVSFASSYACHKNWLWSAEVFSCVTQRRIFQTRRFLVRAMIFCAVFAQLIPANIALANTDGDFQFVICAVGDTKVLSWEEMTGDPAPADDSTGIAEEHCNACLTVCRIAAPPISTPIFIPGVDLHSVDTVEPEDDLPTILHVVGPPLPSRSPPLKAV